MMSSSAMLLLISLLVGSVLGTVMWGMLWMFRHRDSAWLASHDEALLGLLALAAFSMGAFLTYVLLGLGL